MRNSQEPPTSGQITGQLFGPRLHTNAPEQMRGSYGEDQPASNGEEGGERAHAALREIERAGRLARIADAAFWALLACLILLMVG